MLHNLVKTIHLCIFAKNEHTDAEKNSCTAQQCFEHILQTFVSYFAYNTNVRSWMCREQLFNVMLYAFCDVCHKPLHILINKIVRCVYTRQIELLLLLMVTAMVMATAVWRWQWQSTPSAKLNFTHAQNTFHMTSFCKLTIFIYIHLIRKKSRHTHNWF